MPNFWLTSTIIIFSIKFCTAQVNLETDTVLPQFICGDTTLKEYVKVNTHYPEQAKNNCLRGEVTIGFKINSMGNLEAITFLKSSFNHLDFEAYRVVLSTAGKWKPASLNGKPIDYYLQIPFNFWFDDYKCDEFVREDYNRSRLASQEKADKSNINCFNGKQKLAIADYENAIEDFNAALKFWKSNDEALYNRGICKLKLGDTQGACIDFKNVNVKAHPSIKDEINNLLDKYCK